MIRLCGVESNLETVWALARPYAESETASDARQVREAFRGFLIATQPNIPRQAGSLVFLSEGADYDQILKIFNSESFLDDTPYRLENERDMAVGDQQLWRIKQSVEELGQVDLTTKEVFDLTMFTVFWAPCRTAGGGTTSQALGVLWADPRKSWSSRDLLEFLIHELSHNLLFLYEWRHGLFTSHEALLDRDNYALSAIRKTVRPLDKAFHSIVVAAEVLLAREEVLGHTAHNGLHPGSTDLRSGILESITSVAEVGRSQKTLTPHALELLERCEEAVAPLVAEPAPSTF